MKRVIYFGLVMLLAIGFSSCQNKNKLLCKKWIIKKISTNGVTVDVPKFAKSQNDNADNYYMEFDDDGDYLVNMPESFNHSSSVKEKGEWKFNDAKDEIILKSESGIKSKMKIQTLTATELQVEGHDKGDNPSKVTIVMSPGVD